MKVAIAFLAILASAFATKSISSPLRYFPSSGLSYYYPYYKPASYVAASPVVQTTFADVEPVAAAGTNTQYHAQDTLGQYSYGYVTADGQAKVENKAMDGTVTGSYSYTDPEGKPIRVDYVADDKGFRASGDHLPKSLEVPDLPDDLEDAVEDAQENQEKARYRALLSGTNAVAYTYPAPYTYATGTPSYYVTSPSRYYYPSSYYSTTGYPAYQRYSAVKPAGFQYAFNTGSNYYYPGYQRYATAVRPASYGYSYSTGYPGYQRYNAAVRPAGFQYYTSSYAPYTTYPAAYTSYSGGKSAYAYTA